MFENNEQAIESPEETIEVTDYEFIFLGGTKLTHTVRPQDHVYTNAEAYFFEWPDVQEKAIIRVQNLLQVGSRIRKVKKNDKSAIDQIVAEIKAREARSQGVAEGSPRGNTPQAEASQKAPRNWNGR